jgi:6-pyruvoyl-tetrahydropterin synthase
MRLKIRHNMEMAHRLLNDTGKCQNIHGHGMQIELVLLVEEGVDGMAVNQAGQVMEFGRLKKDFREYIDSTYDHRLVLNREDPWTSPIFQLTDATTVDNEYFEVKATADQKFLPGLSLVDGDPTVENLAKWIAEWACKEFRCDAIARIEETKTNGAEAMFHWNGFGASFMKGAR